MGFSCSLRNHSDVILDRRWLITGQHDRNPVTTKNEKRPTPTPVCSELRLFSREARLCDCFIRESVQQVPYTVG
jgi:hypothetical protein